MSSPEKPKTNLTSNGSSQVDNLNGSNQPPNQPYSAGREYNVSGTAIPDTIEDEIFRGTSHDGEQVYESQDLMAVPESKWTPSVPRPPVLPSRVHPVTTSFSDLDPWEFSFVFQKYLQVHLIDYELHDPFTMTLYPIDELNGGNTRRLVGIYVKLYVESYQSSDMPQNIREDDPFAIPNSVSDTLVEDGSTVFSSSQRSVVEFQKVHGSDEMNYLNFLKRMKRDLIKFSYLANATTAEFCNMVKLATGFSLPGATSLYSQSNLRIDHGSVDRVAKAVGDSVDKTLGKSVEGQELEQKKSGDSKASAFNPEPLERRDSDEQLTQLVKSGAYLKLGMKSFFPNFPLKSRRTSSSLEAKGNSTTTLDASKVVEQATGVAKPEESNTLNEVVSDLRVEHPTPVENSEETLFKRLRTICEFGKRNVKLRDVETLLRDIYLVLDMEKLSDNRQKTPLQYLHAIYYSGILGMLFSLHEDFSVIAKYEHSKIESALDTDKHGVREINILILLRGVISRVLDICCLLEASELEAEFNLALPEFHVSSDAIVGLLQFAVIEPESKESDVKVMKADKTEKLLKEAREHFLARTGSEAKIAGRILSAFAFAYLSFPFVIFCMVERSYRPAWRALARNMLSEVNSLMKKTANFKNLWPFVKSNINEFSGSSSNHPLGSVLQQLDGLHSIEDVIGDNLSDWKQNTSSDNSKAEESESKKEGVGKEESQEINSMPLQGLDRQPSIRETVIMKTRLRNRLHYSESDWESLSADKKISVHLTELGRCCNRLDSEFKTLCLSFLESWNSIKAFEENSQ